MPEHRTDTAATPAPDDTLRERLAETIRSQIFRDADHLGSISFNRHQEAPFKRVADALLPLIRDHVAAAVQAERKLPSAASARFQAVRKPNGAAVMSGDLRERVVETLRKYSDRADSYQTGADKIMELIAAAREQAKRDAVDGLQETLHREAAVRERAETAEAARQRVLDLCLSRAKPGRKRGVIRGSISVDEVFQALEGPEATT